MRCAGSVLSREPCFRDSEPGSNFCVRHEPEAKLRRRAGGHVGGFELAILGGVAVAILVIIAAVARVVVWWVTGQ